MTTADIRLERSWLDKLGAEFQQPYMQQLAEFLRSEKRQGKRIFPAGSEIFSAFEHTPLHAVKVVILGQDPYHGEGQAHGLCFSVKPGVKVPPSLQNIYKEINAELGLPVPSHGYLTSWADQGVLLLNSVLSVECARAASHQGKGWETFTDRVIELVNREREGVVFMLWGSYAQRKGAIIDSNRHCVLKAPHPSPLSAHRGFFGCGHFRAANDYLQQRGEAPIDWSLPEQG
ncbi:uracil-DNA glycosylase [Pseudohalioglobus sediminis]|uniref:Uracil-DNA glycosylase n=1 Tax=Pseudohalioglobus sediminis TaxID=2606449 RepID=A0A5B0X1Z7_9GAMM|nr:uracil-DNA glycosylase [Pseudohalioglobus sediminis]KAA1193360.1 uracil-DNA glycosylase [Pseudohalioglobus sediminis]